MITLKTQFILHEALFTVISIALATASSFAYADTTTTTAATTGGYSSTTTASTTDDTTTQKQSYQDAIDKAEEAKKGNEYSAGIWGVTTVLCGYNCFQYMVTLTGLQSTLSGALTQGAKSIALLQSCVGAGNAAAVPVAAALSSCLSTLGTETTTKAIDTGFSAISLAAVPASMSGAAAAEQAHKACQAGLKADHSAAIAAANAQGTTYAAAVVTAGLAAPCFTAAGSVASDMAAIASAEAAYWAASESIISTGYFCAGAAVASAAADLAISKNMAGDISEGMLGAVAAAPAVIGTVVTLATSSSAYVSHNASGITSCVTTGLGAVITANKIVTAQDYQDSIDKNTASRDELARLDRGMLTQKMWRHFFASAGEAVSSLFGSCAYAAVRVAGSGAEAFQLAEACRQSSVSISTRLSCARSQDSKLERMHQTDPGHLPGLMEKFQETFGESALQQVLTQPFNPGLMASLIAKEDPTRIPALANYLATVPAKVTGKALKPSTPPSDLGVPETPSRKLASNLSEASGEADRTPASTRALTPDIATASASIFDSVSKRYRLVRDRVRNEPYFLPYNRYSTGN